MVNVLTIDILFFIRDEQAFDSIEQLITTDEK